MNEYLYALRIHTSMEYILKDIGIKYTNILNSYLKISTHGLNSDGDYKVNQLFNKLLEIRVPFVISTGNYAYDEAENYYYFTEYNEWDVDKKENNFTEFFEFIETEYKELIGYHRLLYIV